MRISVDKEVLADFCKRNHIRKLAFFGSVLRNDFREESDVDALVEFAPGFAIGLLEMAQMEMELSAILGRKADMRTPAELSRYFREETRQNAEVQYAEG